MESSPAFVIKPITAAIFDRPLEHIQVTTLSCCSACPFIPRAALAPEPLDHLQVATDAGVAKQHFIQLELLLDLATARSPLGLPSL